METDRPPARGFTLIEVLVATAILALVVVMLAQIIHSVASAWATSSSSTERRQNGRALADFIGQELRSATLPINLNAAAPNLQFVRNPSSIGTTNNHPSSLFWQAPVATDDAYGDLAEIGYFVRWDKSGSVPSARLCRFFVNPSSTNYLINANANWVTDQLLQDVAPADASSGYVGLFAENVIGLWARFFQADGMEIGVAKDSYDSRVTPKLPASVEISVMLLDSHSAAHLTTAAQERLSTLTDNTASAADCQTQIQSDPSLKSISQGVRTYTTRVFLENSR